jgi:hypothetical protein
LSRAQREDSPVYGAPRRRSTTGMPIRVLIAEAHDDEDTAIYAVATEAAARMSEIRALKVSDVDFRR